MNRCRLFIALLALASPLLFQPGDAAAGEREKERLLANAQAIEQVVGWTGRTATAFMAFNMQGETYACYSAHPRSLGVNDTRGIRGQFGGLGYYCTYGLQTLAALTAPARVATLKSLNLAQSPPRQSESATQRPDPGFFGAPADALESAASPGQKYINPDEEEWPFRWIDELDLWGSLIMFWRIDTCGGGYLIDSCKPPPPPDCSQCWLDFSQDLAFAFSIQQASFQLGVDYFNQALQKLKSCLSWCV